MDQAHISSPKTKFAAAKRKRSQDEHDFTELPAKRPFFRPWLDEPRASVALATEQPQPPRRPTPNSNVAATYHANMVRCHTPRLRSPNAQKRRDRNTLACLLSRRARQAKQRALEQQLAQYRVQHEANMEQQIRLSLYYVRALQQAMATTRDPLPDTQQKTQQEQQDQDCPKQATATKR